LYAGYGASSGVLVSNEPVGERREIKDKFAVMDLIHEVEYAGEALSSGGVAKYARLTRLYGFTVELRCDGETATA
jgi:hypothetical protein